MRNPLRSSLPPLRRSHQAERARVTAAFSGVGSVGPTPGTPLRVTESRTLVPQTAYAARPKHVSRPRQPAARRRRPVVDLPDDLGPLGALPEPQPSRASLDDRASDRAAGQSEAEEQRLEPVGELDFVPLRAAEKLDLLDALRGSELERVEGVDDPRRAAPAGPVECKTMEVRSPPEHEVPGEGDRAAVDLQGDDPVGVAEGSQRRAVEPLARRGDEAGPVRAAAPPELVDPEGVFESRLELPKRARAQDLDLAELRELPAPAPVVAPLPRVRLGAIGRLPARTEIEHGSLDPLEEPKGTRPAQVRQQAHVGETEEVGVVVV